MTDMNIVSADILSNVFLIFAVARGRKRKQDSVDTVIASLVDVFA